ncbi:MAG: hypothetical protein HYS74_02695 [Parcubacteria group bacterium]|nr:hypothetical protein [Parcubacteria group bacterium]
MSFSKLFRNKSFYSITLSVVLSVMFVALVVSAATTISTNISTGGNVTVTGSVFATSTLSVTGKAFFYDQMALDNAASDPTGDAAGALYWDTARRVIRVYNGTDWMSVASSTDASGGLILASDSNGVRFNTIAKAYMTLGTTTVPITSPFSGNAVLLLNSTTTTSIPLAIMGSKGSAQTADLIAVYDESVEVFSVDQAGTVNIASTTPSVTGLNVTGDVYIGTGGLGVGVVETTDDALSVLGATTLTGALTANGAVTLGNNAADAIILTGNASTTNSFSVATRGIGVFSIAGYATTTVSASTFATTTIGADGVLGSALGIGTTSPALSANLGVLGSIHAGSPGTTSLKLHSSGTNVGSCIQMRSTSGVIIRIYATSTPGADASGISLKVEAGECQPI